MKSVSKINANKAPLSLLSALCLYAALARAASWCPAGLRCAGGERPAFCGEGSYCEADEERPCPPQWACPEGSRSPRGVGIRDSSPGIYEFETPAVGIPVDAPAPAFVPVSADSLKRGTSLRSGRDSEMCLHLEGAKDLARVTLRTCDGSPEQIFYMDDSGKIRTRKSAKFCLEMDPSSESWGGVFVHSFCLDKWEILGNGAMRNIGDDKCLGVRTSLIGSTAERLNCPTGGTPQHPQTIWGDVEPYLSADQNPFKYQHCSGLDFGSCVYSTSETNPSTIANDYGFLRESLGRDRNVVGLEEWDSQLVPRNGVWDFEIAVCPTAVTSEAARDPDPLPTCYLIVNRHSGRLLFAKSGMEGAEGVGAGVPGDDVPDDMKWIVAEDPACEGRYCFGITNARSGRELHSLDNLYALPNFGASTVGTLGGANRWSIVKDRLHLESQRSAAMVAGQNVSCGPGGGVLTSFKMQATTDRMSHSFGCDGSFAEEFEPEASARSIAGAPNVVGGGKWECLEPGHLLSGISGERVVDTLLMLSVCADAGANTDACDEAATGPVPLYLGGRRSPNPVAHLSKLPVECAVGQALRSVSLENDGPSARYVYRCCEIIGHDPGSDAPQRAALDQLTAVTNAVSACGARHAWILPGQIDEDNALYDPAKFSDRIAVLLDRLDSVVSGMDGGFRLGGVTEVLLEGRAKIAGASTIEGSIDAAEDVGEIVSARCPSEPVFRWKRAASGTSIETQLEFGLTSEWSEGDFEEFVEGVTESRAELHGKEVSSGSESTAGSSRTIMDSFSVSVGVEASYLFASASLELGYERSEEQSSFQEETSSSSKTQTVELTTDLTQEVSNVLGREVVSTSSISETRTCTASCESEDDNQVIIWQWVYEQTDPNAKDATVHTCTFVCRSASFDTQPVCPGGQCLNNDCTICKRGTFSDPDVDRFYSTERIAKVGTEGGDAVNEGDSSGDSTAGEPAPAGSLGENTKENSGESIGEGESTERIPLDESSAGVMLSVSFAFFGVFAASMNLML